MSNNQFNDFWKLIDIFDFKIDLEKYYDLTCIICKNILKNAYQSPCGCRYCFSCINNYLKNEDKYCPRQLDDCIEQRISMENHLQVDHVANKKISRIIVDCPEKFCEVSKELREMGPHMETHQVNCPFLEMGCHKPSISVEQMNDHLNRENYVHVNLMLESIRNLKNEIATMRENFNEIINELSDQICDIKISNVNKTQEIEILKSNMAEYKVDNKMANSKIAELKNELKIFKESSRKKQVLIDGQNNLKTVNFDWMDTTLLGFQKSRNVENFNLGKRFQNSCPKPSIGKREGKTRILVKEERLGPFAVQLSNHDAGVDGHSSPFEWVVDEFQRRRLDAQGGSNTFVWSDPFYSHERGYKMRLSVNPDGIGSGKHLFVSVFFHLMKGEFDKSLYWPMDRPVTVSLVDHVTKKPICSSRFRYGDTDVEVGKCPFDRPTTDMNVGVGSFTFLNANFLLTDKNFAKLDSLVFQCFVGN